MIVTRARFRAFAESILTAVATFANTLQASQKIISISERFAFALHALAKKTVRNGGKEKTFKGDKMCNMDNKQSVEDAIKIVSNTLGIDSKYIKIRELFYAKSLITRIRFLIKGFRQTFYMILDPVSFYYMHNIPLAGLSHKLPEIKWTINDIKG